MDGSDFSQIPNGGLQTFGSIIIKDLGFTSLNASLLSMPTGMMSTAASVIFSYAAARWTNRRSLVTIFACMVPIIGTALIYALPRDNLAGQMVGLYLVRSPAPLSRPLPPMTWTNINIAVHLLWPVLCGYISCTGQHRWQHKEGGGVRYPLCWIFCG